MPKLKKLPRSRMRVATSAEELIMQLISDIAFT